MPNLTVKINVEFRMMKRLLTIILTLSTLVGSQLFGLDQAYAAGIAPSAGGKHTTAETFTINVVASGATFDSLQGTISVSGPVSIVSFSPGSATWLPGKSPSNGNQFVGIVNATSSLTVASIKLKGTKEGSGAVSVSGVRLARSGSEVGSSGGSSTFTIVRAPTPPGSVKVTSSSHPDESQSYEATKIDLSWERPSGATGFSYLINEAADTTPEQKVTSNDTTVSYADQAVGTHYFHIRAINGDGWGSTTHFKFTIKEPDPQIDETLAGATISKIDKAPTFTTDIENGTLTGLLVSGTIPVGFTTNLAIEPKDRLPGGLGLTATPDEAGNWELTLDKPLPAGFYKFTAQGQKDKVLTPKSPTMTIELSVAQGGSIRVITEADRPKTEADAKISSGVKVLGVTFTSRNQAWLVFIGLLLLVISLIACLSYWWLKRSRRQALPVNTVKKTPPSKPSGKFW